MKLVKLSCPNCGGKVKADPGLKTATCKYCHTEFIIDSEQPTINNYYQSGNYQPGKKPPKAAVIVISVMLALSACLFVFLIATMDSGGSDSSGEIRDLPESVVIQEFTSTVLEKDTKDITTDDLKEIKYVSINYDSISNWYTFEYSFEDYYADRANFDASKKKLMIVGKEGIDMSDVLTMKGLTKLEIYNGCRMDYNQNFSDMKELKGLLLHSNHISLSDLDSFPNPENVKELSMSYSDYNYEKLQEFKNLETLDLYISTDTENLSEISKLKKLDSLRVYTIASEAWDISWISNCTQIKSLEVSDSQGMVTDFNFLYSMNQLNEVNIYSEKLKDLDFVSNMLNLNSVTIDNTSVMTLEPLRDRDSISSLTIGYNSSLNNIDALATLKNLKTLNLLDIANDYALKDSFNVSNMSQLENVSINAYMMPSIANKSTIKNLVVELPSDDGDQYLYGLSGLETLETTAGRFEDVSGLRNLPNLKKVIIGEDTSFGYSGNGAALFSLPIEQLEVRADYFYLDSAYATVNPTLKELRVITEYTNYDRVSGGNDVASDLGMGDFEDILVNLTGLEKLELISANVATLDFASSMPNLTYINIANNYVKDLTPIKDLEYLKVLNIKDNSVQDTKILSDKVVVIK